VSAIVSLVGLLYGFDSAPLCQNQNFAEDLLRIVGPIVMPPHTLEDPLDYLPHSHIVPYNKGQIIYQQNEPSTNLYLIVEGKVKVSFIAAKGCQGILDIYQQTEFFGESAFLSPTHRREQATAMESTKLMTWTIEVIEDEIMRRPRLSVALLQLTAQRGVYLAQRIESFSLDTIERRLARALIRFSERFGNKAEGGDGAIRMPAFTHDVLSQYVGTTREALTQCMIKFRRQGFIKYSRKEIILYSSLREWARHK
jgi:CRP/FNR family cyclic AMP-dependent transcriptional regulator